MKKKYEFDNIPSLLLFDDIETKLKDKNIIININKEKFNFTIEVEKNEDFEVAINFIKDVIPNIELRECPINELYRKIIYLDNLDCGNCAAKIERIAKRTLNHEKIIVDFATTRFIIETTDKELIDNLEDEVKKITKQVDYNIVPRSKEQHGTIDNNEERINKVSFVLSVIGLALFIVALILHYIVFEHTCSNDHFNPSNLSDLKVKEHLVLVIMYGITYLLVGHNVLTGAVKNIISGRVFDEMFLMTLATIMAFIIGSFTEACTVMICYKIGEYIQNHAVNQSRKSIAGLMDIKPQSATIIIDSAEVVVDPQELLIGDIIIVKPGEIIPIDGEVVEGEAALDTSALTGESKYLEVKPNDNVLSGSINVNGYLKIKITKVYSESMITKIIEMVSNASTMKAKTENFVTRFAKYYTPIVCGVAVLLIVLNLLFFQKSADYTVQEYIHNSVYPAMIFLVVSCPCALVISVPLGFYSGIGGCSKKGILIKSSSSLENLGKVGSIVFDKTGTLTKGMFKVKSINPLTISKEMLLEYAAYCEAGSIHPIAKSIVNLFGRDNIDFNKITYLSAPSKKGTIIKYNEMKVAVGSREFMKEIKVKVPLLKESGLVCYVVINDVYEGSIILEDEIKPESKKVVAEIKKAGINVYMMTGDNEETANDVAKKLGIDNVFSNMNSLDKVKQIRKLKKKSTKKILFVGDGMNDAPVLSVADVGIAMGGLGSDAAIGVSDVVLMTDDLTKLMESILRSKKTMRIIRDNIVFSLVIKFFVLGLSIFSLARMWMGVFADVGVSIIAIMNSLRSANIKPKEIFKLLLKEYKIKKK